MELIHPHEDTNYTQVKKLWHGMVVFTTDKNHILSVRKHQIRKLNK